jgi:hypothetical protein
MNLLETQIQFEELWFLKADDKPIPGMRLSDKAWIVYFTAAWCAPCKALDLDKIVDAANAKNIPLWKCDDTINNYTGGYCGVKRLPTFIMMRPKSIVSTLQSAKTQDVVDWISKHLD